MKFKFQASFVLEAGSLEEALRTVATRLSVLARDASEASNVQSIGPIGPDQPFALTPVEG